MQLIEKTLVKNNAKIPSVYKKDVAGLTIGASISYFGSSAALGLASTFGVASTGTAISTLSGAAATNASLAWLGGGALAAGGGGMLVGTIVLHCIPIVGYMIIGFSVYGFFHKRKNDKRLKELLYRKRCNIIKYINTLCNQADDKIMKLQQYEKETDEYINSIVTYTKSYDRMTDNQRQNIETVINLVDIAMDVINKPLEAVNDVITENDLKSFSKKKRWSVKSINSTKKAVLFYSNFIYGLSDDEKDKKLILDFIKSQKAMLKENEISKKDFNNNIIKYSDFLILYKRNL
jgi:hypothetical protein